MHHGHSCDISALWPAEASEILRSLKRGFTRVEMLFDALISSMSSRPFLNRENTSSEYGYKIARPIGRA